MFAAGITLIHTILGMNPYQHHIFGGALGRPPIFITDQFGNQRRQPDTECVAEPFTKHFKWPDEIKQRYAKYPGLLEMILEMVAHVCFISLHLFQSIATSVFITSHFVYEGTRRANYCGTTSESPYS